MHYLIEHIRYNRLALIVVACVAVAAFLAYHINVVARNFDHAYHEYAVASADADSAAYLPGASDNPVRSQMNTALARVLQEKMAPEQRLGLARQGMGHVQSWQEQIDGITSKLEIADAARLNMENSNDLFLDIFAKGLPERILQLAKSRYEAISDVRAYSYRAAFDTRKIFQHVVDANGFLSDEYIIQLNSEIPLEEDAFNRRTNRYSDLQTIQSQIKQAFAEFAARFSVGNTGE